MIVTADPHENRKMASSCQHVQAIDLQQAQQAQLCAVTLANLGPLRRLAGIWEGDKGTHLNPKADGPEKRQYYERVEIQPIDPQTNGPQLFYGLRYHTHIGTREEDINFHDQIGYWLWEPADGVIMQTPVILRGQVALARGQAWKGYMTL